VFWRAVSQTSPAILTKKVRNKSSWRSILNCSFYRNSSTVTVKPVTRSRCVYHALSWEKTICNMSIESAIVTFYIWPVAARTKHAGSQTTFVICKQKTTAQPLNTKATSSKQHIKIWNKNHTLICVMTTSMKHYIIFVNASKATSTSAWSTINCIILTRSSTKLFCMKTNLISIQAQL
jgi:hypothetical protein